MISLIVAQSVALVLLLALSAFFSSSETAFFALDPIQVHRIAGLRPRMAERIQRMLDQPTRLLSTILIGNTAVNVTASALGFELADKLVPRFGEAVAVPVMTALLLVFGEVGPKRISMFWPERMAIAYAPIMPAVIWLLSPIRILVDTTTRKFNHLFLPNPGTLTEEEFETVVRISGEEGVIEDDESMMVRGIIGLGEQRVSDVMTPRVDIAGIDLDDPPEIQLERARTARVRYMPIYRDQLDNTDGFLDVRAYLLDPNHQINPSRIETFYVPEACRLDQLLEQFQQKKMRAAMVVDEYGGTAGVITRGDLLDEITGELGNEFKEHTPLLENLGNNRWLVDGSISLDDLNEATGLHLEAEGADRLSGWVTEVAERLPRTGETVEAQGCQVVVRQMRKNRITLLYLKAKETT